MRRMRDVIAAHTELTPVETDWLASLTEEWEILADVSFSDLILWVPDVDPNVFWAAAQIRPSTGPTALEEDVVGEEISYEADHLVTEAYLSRQICATSGNKLHAGIPVEARAIPVRFGGQIVGVVEMHTNRMGVRAPGELEDTYREVAEVLSDMLWRGDFPMRGEKPVPWVSPKAGDGIIRFATSGEVLYASPNAVSAFRRAGLTSNLLGEHLTDAMHILLRQTREPVERTIIGVLRARKPKEIDIETERGAIRLRVQPLTDRDGSAGGVVLCRDITDLRHRERQLLTKDATIREIHHRVKNNLQTVAALLRLQARRSDLPEVKDALMDAMKRVGAIAVVHEILSQAYDTSVKFDDVADRLMTMVRDVATTKSRVQMRREGTFGHVPADVATNLSLVFTEVCQNAIEHGLAGERGRVLVRPERSNGMLRVDVMNDGVTLPPEFTLEGSSSLGLSIVTSLVSDLDGTFEMGSLGEGFGTRARITIPLD